MKQCPNCKAEIQENARFCLYCMTSFEEKTVIHTEKILKKSKAYVIALVLTVAVLTFIAFVFVGAAFDDEKTEKFSSGEFSAENNVLDNSALFSEENENNSANINFGSSDEISQESIDDSNGANGNASHISDASNVLAENSSSENLRVKRKSGVILRNMLQKTCMQIISDKLFVLTGGCEQADSKKKKFV